jgi:glycosyltransferase involved in cell wall biosynthesis
MKVTYIVTDGGWAGAQRSVQWMAETLDRSRIDARFVFLYSGGPVFEAVGEMGYQATVLNWANGWTISGRWRLIRDVVRNRADILHFHDETPLVRAAIKLVTRVPILYTQHGPPGRITGVKEESAVAACCKRLDDRATRLVLANSQFTYQSHNEYFRRPSTRTRLLYLGLELGRFADLSPVRLNDDQRKPVILFLGRAEEYKGVLELPKLARELLRRGCSDFEIRVAGDGGALRSLEEMLQREGLGRLINPIGVQRNVLPELLGADVLVFPSLLKESFGIAPLEAVAAGVPVVAYDGGAVREVLGNAPGSTIVPRGDIPAMADAVLRTLRGKGCLRRGEGLRYVRDRFSDEHHAGELVRIYEEILRSRY